MILRLQLSAALGTERGTGFHRLAAGRADGRRRRFLSSRLFLYGLCGSLIGINDAIVIIGIIGFDKSDTGAQGFNLIVKAGNLGTVGSIEAFRLGFTLLIGLAAQFQQGGINIRLNTENFCLELGDLAEVFWVDEIFLL